MKRQPSALLRSNVGGRSTRVLATGAPRKAGNSAVAELLDSIIKKKSFKQLAGYSIKCLRDLLQPSRIGWEILARAAFDMQGCIAVLDLLQKYYNDPELMDFGLSALQSMVCAPGVGAVDGPTLAASVTLLATVWGAQPADMPDPAKAAAIASLLQYFVELARKSGDALCSAQVLDLLDALALALASGWPKGAPSSGGPIAVLVLRLLGALTATRQGLAAVASRQGLALHTLQLALSVYQVHCDEAGTVLASGKGGATGRGASAPAASGARPATGVAALPTAGAPLVRAVVEPLFRLFSKLARSQTGLAALASCDAVAVALPLADWWLHTATDDAVLASLSASGGSGAGPSDASSSSGSGLHNAAAAAAAAEHANYVASAALVVDLFARLTSHEQEGVMRLVNIACGRDANVNKELEALAAATGDAAAAAIKGAARRRQAARVLARIAELPDVLQNLSTNADLLTVVLALLGGVTDPTSTGLDLALALPLLTLLMRVADRSIASPASEGLTIMLSRGALPVVLQALATALCVDGSTVPGASATAAAAAAAAAFRCLHPLLAAAGHWKCASATGVVPEPYPTASSPAPDSACDATVAGWAMSLWAPKLPPGFDSVLAALKPHLGAQYGNLLAATSSGSLSPLPLLMLAGSLSLVAVAEAVPGRDESALPRHVAGLSAGVYALACLKEVFMGVDEATAALATNSAGAAALVPALAAALAAATTLTVEPPTNVDSRGLGNWQVATAAVLLLQIFSSLLCTREAAVAAVTAGVGKSLIELLASRSVSDLLSKAGGKGNAGAGGLSSLISAGTASGYLRRSGSGRAINDGSGMGALKAAAQAAQAEATPLLGAHWTAAALLEQPAWIALLPVTGAGAGGSGGSGSSSSGTGSAVAANPTRPQTVAAEALQTAGAVVMYLVAYAQEGAASTAADAMPEPVLRAITPLASLSDMELSVEDGLVPGSPAAIARQSANSLLQAALVAYSQYSADALVYSRFRELVDLAAVGSEEVVTAIDTLRGVAAVLQGLVLDAPTRGVSNTNNAVAASVWKNLEAAFDGSEGALLERSDAEVASARAAGEARVRARMSAAGVGRDYLSQVAEACAIARQKLLLLEAVSLSPFLAWCIVAYNGVTPILRVVQALVTAINIHGDLDLQRIARLAGTPAAGSTPVTPPKLLERVDIVFGHAVTTMAHLCRVAYEARAMGEYTVLGEDEDVATLPAALDVHLATDALLSRDVAYLVCTAVPLATVAGQHTPSAAAAMTQLLYWLGAAVNLTPAYGDKSFDPAWPAYFGAELISYQFVEAAVALFRFTLGQLTAARAARAAGAAAGGRAAMGDPEAAMMSALDRLTSLVASMTAVAGSKVGATAVATRGGSRQVLRCIPLLLTLCDGNREGPAYRLLVAGVRLLHSAVMAGGAERNVDDDGSGGGDAGSALSVGALLHKQGLVDMMVQIAFSGVGITSAAGVGAAAGGGAADFSVYGEACELAVELVSAVSTRRDVITSVTTLYEMCTEVAGAVSAFTASAMAETDTWNAIAAAGDVGAATGMASSLQRAVLNLSKIQTSVSGQSSGSGAGGAAAGAAAPASGAAASGAADASGSGEGGDAAPGAASHTLLGAIQLFGLLIVTDAGRRSGLELASQGLAACAALAQSGITYMALAARLQEAVAGAVATLTTSSDDSKPAAPLPAAIAGPAAASLAPLTKAERDITWAVVLSTQVQRVSLGVLIDIAQSRARDLGIPGLNAEGLGTDELTALAAESAFVQQAMGSVVDTLVTCLEVGNSSALAQLTSAALGLAQAAALPKGGAGGAKGGASVAASAAAAAAAAGSAFMPTQKQLLAEAAAALSLACFNVQALARDVPPSAEGAGLTVLLGVLAGPEALAGAAAAAGGAGGAGGSSGAGASGSGGSGDRRGPDMEVACHILVALGGIARAAPEMPGLLSAAGAGHAVLRLIGDVLAYASSCVAGPAAAAADDDLASPLTTLALMGTAGSFSTLAALAGYAAAEASDMLSSGAVSYIQGGMGLCREETASSPRLPPPFAALLTSLSALLTKLATTTTCLSVVTDAAGEEVDTSLSLSLRDLLVRDTRAGLSGRSYIENVPCMLRLFEGILLYGQEGPTVPASSGERTVDAIRAAVPKAIPAVRRAMANPNATPYLLKLGREVIALLTPKSIVPEPTAEPAAPGAPAPAPVEEEDEVVIAVRAAYGRLYVLHGMFDAPVVTGAAVAEASAKLDECLEALQTLSQVLPPYFPVREPEDTADPVWDPKYRTRATVWQIFCTAREYIQSIYGLLASQDSAPTSPRIMSALYDLMAAAMPVVARMSVFAEVSRQAVIQAYWAGKASTWELPAERDVPMQEAVSTLGQAVEAHVVVADRTLRPSASQAAVAAARARAGNEAFATYVPLPVCIEIVCKGLRNLAGGAGHDAVAALVDCGVLTNVLHLAGSLRVMRERVQDGSGETSAGDREAARALAADADRGVQALVACVRFLASKAQSEVQVYCVPTGGNASTAEQNAADELRDVATVLPASALAGLLRATAIIAVDAPSSEGGSGEEEDGGVLDAADAEALAKMRAQSQAASAVLEAQVRGLLAANGGLQAVFGVMEELGSHTLAAASLAAPLREVGGQLEARIQVKLFHALVSALHVHIDKTRAASGLGAKDGPHIPATMQMLRGLYASILNATQLLLGEGMVAATHAAVLVSLYHDTAAEEFQAPKEDVKPLAGEAELDVDLEAWIVPPTAPKLESSAFATAPVDEI